MCVCVCVLEQMPHLEHLLDVILNLGVNNAVHVPLQHFDQVPGENKHTRTLSARATSQIASLAGFRKQR